jgi:hypothetical protein
MVTVRAYLRWLSEVVQLRNRAAREDLVTTARWVPRTGCVSRLH